MILKLIINNGKKKKNRTVTAWIQKDNEFKDDVQQLFQFFKDNIKISEKRRFHEYYKVTSERPAIMMSLFSTVHELIPEVYFSGGCSYGTENSPDLDNLE